MGNNPEVKKCEQCGKSPVNNRFCSHKCYHESLKGSNNPNYKENGSYKKKHGVRIKVDGKQVGEHRFIMEKILRRKLESDEIVIHIDGDKMNNDPKNLVVVRQTNEKNYKRVRVHGKEYPEHRLIMEKALGRKLKRSERIIHIDGDKRNNNLNNLIVIGK